MTNSIDERNACQFVLDHFSHFPHENQVYLFKDVMTALAAARSSRSGFAPINPFASVSKHGEYL